MIEMAEYVSSYKEGFDGTIPTTNAGSMTTIFNNLLQVQRTKKGVNTGEPTSFLKTFLTEQKNTVDSLMATAKKIGPSAQKIVQADTAYNAAFESDAQAAVPTVGGTLQGFILIFFFISYIVLTLVITLMIYLSVSGGSAAGTFVGFLLFGVCIFALLFRFG